MSPQISPRMWLGIDEPWIARVAKSHINQGDVIYDIGAHIGYTSLLFSKYLNQTGIIHAFEILPSTEKLLSQTIQANKCENVRVHNIGCGGEDQTISLPVGNTAMTSLKWEFDSRLRTEECVVRKLDTYMLEEQLPTPDLVKMDIEGAEIDCLRGMKSIFANRCPKMLIAFHSKQLLRQGVRLLSDIGYVLEDKHGVINHLTVEKKPDGYNDTVLCLPNIEKSEILGSANQAQ